jgi:hypothetical protein
MNGRGAMSVGQASPRESSKTLESRLPVIQEAILWLAPPLLCLILYRYGLRAWFQSDDFAWLALSRGIHSGRDLLYALFAPMAQGTIRTLSERGFFLLFGTLFGVHAFPFRIWVFLTQCANLIILNAVTRRLTGSRAAGFWAATLWAVNFGASLPMVWTSVYNQTLLSFFLLGAFWFLLRYIETGRSTDNLGQWVMFVAGFGALETNVVYPVLAALYTFLCARKYFRSTIPLFVPSALFTAIHVIAAPPQSSGAYALHFDRAIAGTFWTYWSWALAALQGSGSWQATLKPAFVAALTLALLAFALARALKRDWLPVFGLAWFVVALGPLLPLRDHISDYYLAAPAIGLAILGACGLVCAWRGAVAWKVLATVLVVIYARTMIYADWYAIKWWYDRSQAVERLVLGVERARELHPTEGILLDGVDSNLFWAGVFYRPFRVFGVTDVFLTPGSERGIEVHRDLGDVADFVLPSGATLRALNNNQIVVYRCGLKRLKAITSSYAETTAQQLRPEPPRRIDVGTPLMAYLLGPEWYSPDDGLRWMPKRATLQIGGPRSSSERLYMQGNCPESLLQQGRVPLRVTVDGAPLPETTLGKGDSQFDLSFPLPPQAVGRNLMNVTVEAGRAVKVGPDAVEFALRLGVFEVR